ncbi:hypothetical protein SO694_00057059 [Aureococcus anophagefferens]|uniref:Uncharacterized protein n=1 Tax=Aureococcus anophagefferens TaxID=44056 RepID=A0ABR1FXC5_AURAN
MQTETKRKPAASAAAAPRADDAPPAPDAPLRVPKVEGAPAPGVLHCLVDAKLLFSVRSGDASWRVAATCRNTHSARASRGASRLTIAGLDHLSFEAVGKRAPGAGAAARRADPPAARTDMLSSSMTFQVMADEIR